MDPRDLKRILDAVKEADVNELNLETSDFKLNVKRGGLAFTADTQEVIQVATPREAKPLPIPAETAKPATPETAAKIEPPPAQAPSSRGIEVKAPIVGTFYRAASPDTPAFVEIGDRVEPGKVLCILEAMKLMNEIESEVSGIVREIRVSNAEPVEYGQVLFVIEPA